jgi:hypothetical protein
MRSNFTLLLLFFFYASSIKAQSASSNVVSPGGGYAAGGNYSLEWTLGETIAATSLSSTVVYTQGFNQPVIIRSMARKMPVLEPLSVTALPNPFNAMLTIVVTNPKGGNHTITITDINGFMMFQKTSYPSGSALKVNLNNLAAGMYLLHVYDEKDALLQTTKLIKL